MFGLVKSLVVGGAVAGAALFAQVPQAEAGGWGISFYGGYPSGGGYYSPYYSGYRGGYGGGYGYGYYPRSSYYGSYQSFGNPYYYRHHHHHHHCH